MFSSLFVFFFRFFPQGLRPSVEETETQEGLSSVRVKLMVPLNQDSARYGWLQALHASLPFLLPGSQQIWMDSQAGFSSHSASHTEQTTAGQ